MSEQEQVTQDQQVRADFGAEPTQPLQPCSWMECGGGHKWGPTLGLAQCRGCGGGVLAVKMENCPVCNEPASRMVLRVDRLPQGGEVVKFCEGQPTPAEVKVVEIVWEGAEQAEAMPVGTSPLSVKVVQPSPSPTPKVQA